MLEGRRAGCQGRPQRLTRRMPISYTAPTAPRSKRKGRSREVMGKKERAPRGATFRSLRGRDGEGFNLNPRGRSNNGLSAQPTRAGRKETGASVVAQLERKITVAGACEGRCTPCPLVRGPFTKPSLGLGMLSLPTHDVAWWCSKIVRKRLSTNLTHADGVARCTSRSRQSD